MPRAFLIKKAWKASDVASARDKASADVKGEIYFYKSAFFIMPLQNCLKSTRVPSSRVFSSLLYEVPLKAIISNALRRFYESLR